MADAEPGLVRIYAESGGTPEVPGGTGAAAIFQDYLTVSSAPLNATLQVTFAVDGFGNDTYDGIRENPRTASLTQDTLQIAGQTCTPVLNTLIPSGVAGSCTVSVPVTSGSPIGLGLHLQGYAENRSNDLSILDFGHTGRISSLELLDANGARVSGATISTASGFTYPTSESPAPEPATFCLFAIASTSCLIAMSLSARSRDSEPKPERAA